MIQFQPFSCASQIITVNDKWMCFDKKAALQLERTNHDKDTIIKLQNSIIEVCDSSLTIKNREIAGLRLMVSNLINKDKDCKKGKLRSFLTGTGTGAIVALILVIVL